MAVANFNLPEPLKLTVIVNENWASLKYDGISGK